MAYTLCLLFLVVDAVIAALCIRELIRRGGWDR